MENTIICIPTYNEAENVPSLVARIFSLYPTISVLIIDDNSPDGTSKIVENLKPKYPNLKLLNRSGKKRGFANSYKDGFNYALENNFEWIVQMDADFSHDPAKLQSMFDVRDNYDLIIGSRYTKGGKTENWPLKRKLLSRAGNLYAKVWLNTGIKDMTGGFNMWHKDALNYIKINSLQTDGYSFLVELKFHASRAKLGIKEIPITFVDRTAAKSKMSPQIFREAVFAVPALRIFKCPSYSVFKRPSRVSDQVTIKQVIGE